MLSAAQPETSATSTDNKAARYITVKVGDKLPGYTAPCWKRWSIPVKRYLVHPKTWKQLDAWAEEQDIPGTLLRQMIAWMDLNRIIQYDASTKKWSRT